MRFLLTCFLLLSAWAKANTVVDIKTNMGTISVELFDNDAPDTVDNFLSYVKDGFYDGVIVHRVIPNFVIQAGGFTSDMKRKNTRGPIANEAHNHIKNERGTVAMARTSDPHSATAQFFINLVDNNNLNAGGVDPYGYAVFGKVIKGMDTVDKIGKVPTNQQDIPKRSVVIEKITIQTPVEQKDKS